MKTIARVVLATALVLGGSGCAKTDWIDRTLVTVDVTGNWYGGGANTYMGLDLKQEGSKVKGSMRVQGGGARGGGYVRTEEKGPVEGAIAGDVFSFKLTNSSLEGELRVTGDEMNGPASMFGARRPISLRRVDPSSPPASPPR